MRVLITSAYNKLASHFSDITAMMWKEYSKLHNYECVIKSYEFSYSMEKLKYLNELINNTMCDYIVWVDSDIFIINMEFQLKTIIDNNELKISSDNMGICSGAMILKNSAWVKQCLTTLLFLGETSLDTDLITNKSTGWFVKQQARHDQNGFKILSHYFESFKSKISLIPESIIQNPASTFNKDAFAFHFWSYGWTKQDKMIEHINKIKQVGYYPLNNWWDL